MGIDDLIDCLKDIKDLSETDPVFELENGFGITITYTGVTFNILFYEDQMDISNYYNALEGINFNPCFSSYYKLPVDFRGVLSNHIDRFKQELMDEAVKPKKDKKK